MKKSFNFWIAGLGVMGALTIIAIAVFCNLPPAASSPSSTAEPMPSRLESSGETEDGDGERSTEFEDSKAGPAPDYDVPASSGASSQPSVPPQAPSAQTPATVPPVSEQQPPEEAPALPARPCLYTSRYGDKTPAQVASEDYYVKYLYDELESAQANYDETVRMYSKSTSEQFRNKILQAEFALNKARILYQREYDEAFARYNDMKSQCPA